MNTLSNEVQIALNKLKQSASAASLVDLKVLEDALRKEREEAVPVADSDKCDPDVFENGRSACLVAISKDDAETICRGISAATGCRVDWHYVGGRVHIKALYIATPAQPVAVPELKELEAVLDWILMLPVPTQKATQMAKRLAVVIDSCRAAMLAAAPGKEG